MGLYVSQEKWQELKVQHKRKRKKVQLYAFESSDFDFLLVKVL